MRGIDDAGDGQPVLGFPILHGMASGQHGARLMRLVRAAAQYLRQHVKRQPVRLRVRPGRKKRDVHGAPRLAAHGVHVGKSIGGGNLSEHIGIVPDGGKDIHGLHQRPAVRHAHDGGIFIAFRSAQQTALRVFGRRQRLENTLQKLRSKLRPSAGGPGFGHQRQCGHAHTSCSTRDAPEYRKKNAPRQTGNCGMAAARRKPGTFRSRKSLPTCPLCSGTQVSRLKPELDAASELRLLRCRGFSLALPD